MLHWQQKAEFFTETGNKYATLLRWRIGFEPVMLSNSAPAACLRYKQSELLHLTVCLTPLLTLHHLKRPI